MEDMWRKISIGHIGISYSQNLRSCPTITTDQSTAVIGKETWKTLATYRRAQKGVIRLYVK